MTVLENAYIQCKVCFCFWLVYYVIGCNLELLYIYVMIHKNRFKPKIFYLWRAIIYTSEVLPSHFLLSSVTISSFNLFSRNHQTKHDILLLGWSLTNFYHIMFYRIHLTWTGFKFTTLVVIGTDSMDSYKANHYMLTTMTTPRRRMLKFIPFEIKIWFQVQIMLSDWLKFQISCQSNAVVIFDSRIWERNIYDIML